MSRAKARRNRVIFIFVFVFPCNYSSTSNIRLLGMSLMLMLFVIISEDLLKRLVRVSLELYGVGSGYCGAEGQKEWPLRP